VFLLAIDGASNWKAAGEILFEPEGLRGNIKESDQEGESVTSDAGKSVDGEGILWSAGDQANAERVMDKTGTLNCNKGQRGDYIVPTQLPFRKSKRACSETDHETWVMADSSNTLNNFDLGDTRTTHAVVYENHPSDSRVTGPLDVAPTVVSRFGTGGGNVPLVNQEAVIYENNRRDGLRIYEGTCPTLQGFMGTGGNNVPMVSGEKIVGNQKSHWDGGPHPTLNQSSAKTDGVGSSNQELFAQGGAYLVPGNPTAYSIREDAIANNFSATPLEVTPALQALRPSVQSHHAQTFVAQTVAVRRLTPVECERLQGFPDNYSQIPWKGKPSSECPDGPRYKACGNSFAVPVVRWIGERIQKQIDGTL
jgi:site-specific DNA-cytosine methylase